MAACRLQLAMQVSLERRPGSVVELAIEVPTEQVESAIERAYNRLSPQVRVPGFRPGKAPRPILEQAIGWETLKEQALELLVPELLTEAIRDNNLEAIDQPHVHIEAFERLQPARIVAHVTVKPEVKLGDVNAINAAVAAVEVGSDEVDKTIEELRAGLATLVPADNRPVTDGDHLVLDLDVQKDGVSVDDKPGEDLELDVDKESLLPDLYAGLSGMEQGTTKDISVHLPDDYSRTELAGQDVVFKVTLKEIKERELPPVDDELAKSTGGGETLADLRQKIEERLRAVKARDAVFDQQKAALDQLLASTEVEVPEVLVEDEIDRQIRNLAVRLGQQGIDLEKLVQFGGADAQKLRDDRRAEAQERVRQELALDALATAENIVPSEAHVDAEARGVLEGADDADRLASSDRVKAYVRERMRLQWALLWLAAKARDEEFVPPSPEELAAPAVGAAEELLEQEPQLVDSAGAPLRGEAGEAPAEAVATAREEGGMTEI